MATSRSSSSRVMCKRIYCEHCEDYVSRSTYRRHQKERKTYEMENEDKSSEVSYYLQASVNFTRQHCCWSKIKIQKLLRAMLINSVIFLNFLMHDFVKIDIKLIIIIIMQQLLLD